MRGLGITLREVSRLWFLVVFAAACSKTAPVGQTNLQITIVSGDKQTVAPGKRFDEPVVLKVASTAGSPVM